MTRQSAAIPAQSSPLRSRLLKAAGTSREVDFPMRLCFGHFHSLLQRAADNVVGVVAAGALTPTVTARGSNALNPRWWAVTASTRRALRDHYRLQW